MENTIMIPEIQVLMVVSMKVAVFWVVMSYSQTGVYQRFRGAGQSHHHGCDDARRKNL
jgi:hypothetical protein